MPKIVEKETSKINNEYKKYNTNSTSSSKYSSTIGLVGLNNIGNTCFMYLPSIIQELNPTMCLQSTQIQ